jgi:hypothetical protein
MKTFLKSVLVIVILIIASSNLKSQEICLGLDKYTILAIYDNNYFDYGYTKDSINYLSTVIDKIKTVFYFDNYNECYLINEESLTIRAYKKRIEYLNKNYDKGSDLTWTTYIQSFPVIITLKDKYFIYEFAQ